MTFAGLLLFTFAWIVVWYWSTAYQIAGIWLRSDTYAHGLAVLPVFIWLVWRKREAVGAMTPQPLPWMALPVAAMGFVWLLAQMVSVDGLAHFALIGIIVLTFTGVLGLRLSRVLLFPLLFLFFGLPIGDFIQPTLMHYTAEFTVFALRQSGVPVYQEGLYFVVPNGRWSVVEACSGLRYLVATLFVGALYAYLNYVSLTRRVLFMLVAVLVPIVANWLRAYLIVMIGYLSDNRLAAGVDHLIYGWVFFGVVILLLFWIGSWWREDSPLRVLPGAMSGTMTASDVRPWPAMMLLALVTAAFPLIQQHIDEPVPPFSVALEAPPAAEGWQAVDESVLDFVPNFSGHRGELFQAYRREADGATLGLYVAYYARQREDTEMVTWQNRLIGREGVRGWFQISTGRDLLPVGPVVLTLLRRDGSPRLAVWRWYWTNHRVVATDVMAKIILAIDHLTRQPDDAAFIAVFTPYVDRPDEVRPLVEEFLDHHAKDIEAALLRVELE